MDDEKKYIISFSDSTSVIYDIKNNMVKSGEALGKSGQALIDSGHQDVKEIPLELQNEFCLLMGKQILFHSPDLEETIGEQEKLLRHNIYTILYIPEFVEYIQEIVGKNQH